MTALLLDGRATAQALRDLLRQEVQAIQQAHQYVPGLAVVQVGVDSASALYVAAKIKCAKDLGIASWHYSLSDSNTQDELQQLICALNNDPCVHGILVQLPLPASIDQNAVLNAICPDKDVDGLHFVNQGRLYTDDPGIYPCTPLGCFLLLQRYNIDLAGKHVVVLGRSRLVGRPLAQMMLSSHATVTICHVLTPCISDFTKTADILISAVGKPGLVTGDMVKEGVIIVDIGISRTPYGIKGDVDFDSCKPKAMAITPVPGGVGPMTVGCLMYNTLIAASRQNNHRLVCVTADPFRYPLW